MAVIHPFPPCHALSYFSLTFPPCHSLKSDKLEKVELELFESGNIAVGDIVSLLDSQCCLHTETSQLICIVNQLPGFYMRATLASAQCNIIKAS